jgi:hypothetical protein
MIGSCRLRPMTGRTVRIELGFTHLELGWHRTAPNRLLWLRGVAGDEEADRQQPYSDMRS